MKTLKNDQSFVCQWCGHKVEPLNYTSRDHCPVCLVSKHVDIVPGDRANECAGLMMPVGVDVSAKKGYVIHYKCAKCRAGHNNKAAQDDNMKAILSLMNGSYNANQYKQ